MTILFIAVLAVVPATLALEFPHIHIPNPFHSGGGGHDVKPQFCPIIDQHEDVTGMPWQVGVSVPGGGSMSYTIRLPEKASLQLGTNNFQALEVQETHEIGTTWEQGKELGISVGYIVSASAAISISVAETVTDSLAETGSQQCPDGVWHCSLLIYPALTRIRGHVKELGPNDKCNGGQFGADNLQDGATWVLVLPRKDAAGNGVWGLELCTCKNLPYAPGHPENLCTSDCADTRGH
ncbi:hypothetical protein IWX49DRAFT_577123 [Phyllosticta citricarpa]|uniref:Uncharacterized protein n=2 Tax=Phyllosticta TaxID=121621 RepID=A0ABR1LYV7_9PEZI